MYIEKSPNERTIIFNDSSEWHSFFDKVFGEMVNKFGLGGYREKWIYEKFKIKKNGERARSNDGSSLNTKSARKKQEIGWKKYLDKKRKNAEMVKKNKEDIISRVNNFLSKEGYFFNLCSGGYYTLKYDKTKRGVSELKQNHK